MEDENQTMTDIDNYIKLLTSSLQKIQSYNSSCLIYSIEGSHIILQIYSALILNNTPKKEIISICEGAIQLFVNCLYILDNIKTTEIGSYIDIIKELLYSKSIGNIQISSFNNTAESKKIFTMLKTITQIVLLNETSKSRKNIQIIGKLMYVFNEINEMNFFNQKIQNLLISNDKFAKQFDVFCISSVISLQIYS